MNLVEISHVSKRFGDFTAVNDVSLSLAKGEILGLLGANGAGKTTLIRMICDLLRPDGGQISVQGRPGYMCQTFSLVEELTVHENIRFYATLAGLGRAQTAAREEAMVASLELTPYLNRQVKLLPSGWRQALSFSIAVIADPPVLILDEPTSGLDALSRRRMWKLIQAKAAEGTGVIVSTHYLDEAYYCSRLTIMNGGRVVASGVPQELAATQQDFLTYFR
ncbi:MAG: ABC transporter ATP-binding protein [Bacteroidales bacterium]|nr:ABC transporter ATP-binding protein [Bacteroidales bacterium]MBR6876146.1 ABC transporter ATP-binding protein [Bacteroidales bacterium]